MVRRTKQEAQATRAALLDAAEQLFQSQGVSRTSLQDIAHQAGTTRGAIYWHFKDKADLFNAMMERVTLPMETSFGLHQGLHTSSAYSIIQIRQATLDVLQKIAEDAQTRRVFEVATHKVEYVAELQAVRARHLKIRQGFLARVQQSMAAALAPNAPAPCAAVAAQGLHALVDGLIQNWLLDTQAFDLLGVGKSVLDAYLRGLGLSPH